jgi:hypothetical protein
LVASLHRSLSLFVYLEHFGEVVVFDQRVRQADPVRAHGVPAAVVEGAWGEVDGEGRRERGRGGEPGVSRRGGGRGREARGVGAPRFSFACAASPRETRHPPSVHHHKFEPRCFLCQLGGAPGAALQEDGGERAPSPSCVCVAPTKPVHARRVQARSRRLGRQETKRNVAGVSLAPSLGEAAAEQTPDQGRGPLDFPDSRLLHRRLSSFALLLPISSS